MIQAIFSSISFITLAYVFTIKFLSLRIYLSPALKFNSLLYEFELEDNMFYSLKITVNVSSWKEYERNLQKDNVRLHQI